MYSSRGAQRQVQGWAKPTHPGRAKAGLATFAFPLLLSGSIPLRCFIDGALVSKHPEHHRRTEGVMPMRAKGLISRRKNARRSRQSRERGLFTYRARRAVQQLDSLNSVRTDVESSLKIPFPLAARSTHNSFRLQLNKQVLDLLSKTFS